MIQYVSYETITNTDMRGLCVFYKIQITLIDQKTITSNILRMLSIFLCVIQQPRKPSLLIQ
jgi:hypothetical protein